MNADDIGRARNFLRRYFVFDSENRSALWRQAPAPHDCGHAEGARIIEYTGERVSWESAPDDDDDPHTFNFGLENGDVINPEVGGNDARWINHSCDPNCETVEEDDRIFIYAVRNIQPGEELLYDYHMELDEPITESAKKKFACHCGASNCRGTMIEL